MLVFHNSYMSPDVSPYPLNLTTVCVPPPPPLSLVKFEDCQHSKEVGFESSDPNFSVRPDGSVYAEQEVANLSEPIQFMVTARGGHDPHIWETTVKLALVGHQPSVPVSQVNIYTLLKL